MEWGFYEDISIGEKSEFGSYTVEKDEMISFAESFDPQPIHTDEAVAKESTYNGLIASGLYTIGIGQRMVVNNVLRGSSARGALGVDHLRWKNPVYPGDTLRTRVEVVDKRPWIDDIGLVNVDMKMFNQDDEKVLSLVVIVQYKMRGDEG